jgi:hypothetical protein
MKLSLNKTIIVFFSKNLPKKISKFNLAIISTTADVRLKIIKNIIPKIKVKNWILEKILTQSIEDLEKIKELLHKQKVWVNTPDRIFNWSKKIKFNKNSIPISKCIVRGNNWGLVCNSLHLIDFFSWWTGEALIECNAKDLDKNWFRSNRKNFIETSGTLYFKYSGGSSLLIECSINDAKPMSLNYQLDDWKINKFSGYAKRNDGLVVKGKIDLVSDYMTSVVEGILKDGKSDLPTLKLSYAMHKIFLGEIINSWNEINIKKKYKIPIT